MINIDQFHQVEMRAGKILSAGPLEGSDKLLRLSVDFGEEKPRTVVSGIKRYFQNPEELVGILCGFVTNLEPRPIMGIKSQAMILAVSTEETFSLLKIDESIPPGTKVK